MADTLRSSGIEASSRESLLDVLLERVAKAGKAVILSRIVYVARLVRRESSVDQLRANLGKMIDKYSQEGDLTGMLVVYPLCYVHTIEGKTTQLMAFLHDLLSNSSDLKLNETRVISSTEDIPARYFNGWYSTYVPSNSTVETMDPLDAFGAVKSANDINTFLRKLGATLVSPNDGETRRKLISMESYYEDVPPQEVLLSLVPTEDAPTLREYLDIFDSPVNVDLESEQVWPMPQPLKY